METASRNKIPLFNGWLAEKLLGVYMRNKTMQQLCTEAAKYAIETLDIEKCLTIKLLRDTERAETQLCIGFDVDIEYEARRLALQLAANELLANRDFSASIESELYRLLDQQRVDGKTRLNVELGRDEVILNVNR